MRPIVRAAVVLLALVALASVVGCAPAPSQLVVSIDSDLPVDREPPTAGDGVLRAVRVLVCESRCDADAARDERLWTIGARSDLGQIALPLSFGVAPRDPANPGSVEIVVEALRSTSGGIASDVLFTTSRRITFSPGRVAVPIFLSAGCRGRACPEGTTCGDDGQCTGTAIDAGAPDADVADASIVADTGVDASPIDAATPEDAAMLDAPAIDAPLDAFASRDAGPADAPGPDAATCASPVGVGPGEPTYVSGESVAIGTVTAVSFAPDGSELVAGRGSGVFEFDGARSDVSAYFVSRRGAGGSPSWTTFITYDTARRAPWSSIVRVLERDGVVYVAGQAAEGWTSGTVSVAELAPGTSSDSRRVGTILLGMSATTGTALWGHSLKSIGPTEFIGGFTVDATGGWLVTRWFGSSPTDFLLDGVSRGFDRGVANGRVHLVHVRPTGSVDVVHGIDGPSFSDVDVVSVEHGDVIVALAGNFSTASSVRGLGRTVTDGELVIARLAADGSFQWASTLDCAVGTWSPLSAKLAAHGGHAFLAWSASRTSTGSTVCSSLRVYDVGGVTTHPLALESTGWLGAIAIEPCSGAHDAASLWRASVNSSPLSAFTSLDADERGVAGTGYFGVGGASLGLGVLAGHDTGMGTDGFLVVFDHGLAPVHTSLFGARASAIYTVDDGGEHVAIGHGSLLLALALTGADSFGSVDLASGGSALSATLP